MSSAGEEGGSLTQQQQPSTKAATTKTRVADYFAVLGVGDSLIWKHAQKQKEQQQQQQQQQQNEQATEPDNSNNNTSDLCKEEKNDLQEEEERFYREIVQVAILTIPEEDTSCNVVVEHDMPTSIQQQQQGDISSNRVNNTLSEYDPINHALADITPSSSHMTDSSTDAGVVVDSHASHTKSLLSIPPASPSHSETTAASSFQQQQHTRGPYFKNNQQIQHHPLIAANEGWTVLQTTLPSANPVFAKEYSEEELSDYFPNHSSSSSSSSSLSGPSILLYNKGTLLDANLNPQTGLFATIMAQYQRVAAQYHRQRQQQSHHHHHWKQQALAQRLRQQHPLKQLAAVLKRSSTNADADDDDDDDSPLQRPPPPQKFYVAYRRRRRQPLLQVLDDDDDGTETTTGIADLQLYFVRLHVCTFWNPVAAEDVSTKSSSTATTTAADATAFTISNNAIAGLGSLLEKYQPRVTNKATTNNTSNKPSNNDDDNRGGGKDDEDERNTSQNVKLVPLTEYLSLPAGFDEWCIPADYQWIQDPASAETARTSNPDETPSSSATRTATTTTTATILYADDSNEEFGVEAIDESVVDRGTRRNQSDHHSSDPNDKFPKLMSDNRHLLQQQQQQAGPFFCIPVLAVRRQRVGEEERFHEDPAVVDIAVTFGNHFGDPVRPEENASNDNDDEDDFLLEEEDDDFRILGKTHWSAQVETSSTSSGSSSATSDRKRLGFGVPMMIVRRNVPYGFADVAFATRVLGRFPFRNYKGLPLPEEELPMFCYPTGCRLHRARFSDAPVAQYYGFVVKNERGDNIYVSCVSFMEPLTPEKSAQLAVMSAERKHTSIPHRKFCDKQKSRNKSNKVSSNILNESCDSTVSTEADSNFLLTSFDEMTTFENKTICLVSRYPFWTAFRKFLLHLHILSGSASDLPLERYISHLLLAVPLPKAGGSNVLVPLPALSEPMVLSMPPEKDFTLVDLPYHRLFACLEIRTVVTIVLSLLALERKLIVMSTRPSLVLDVCELLRSLLFPFELCAPYVPRLTEPFKSSLDFPGAIFVGIHDDGSPNGLASTVKHNYPEDSIVVNLDNGEIDCDGNSIEVISKAWDIIPATARSNLVSELETLCHDASIVDGQEPLDSQFDSAFHVVLESAVDDVGVSNNDTEPFDDRAARDAFLRFFCSVLGGYERFLVVPDADFLVSGNEWFDAKGFLSSVPTENAPYLNSLCSTQLFQSFIQRRTEASDVHCLLFDECLAEFHSSSVPYGRLGGDVEVFSTSDDNHPKVLYSLLVDQSATGAYNTSLSAINLSRSMDTVDEDTLANLSKLSASATDHPEISFAESAVNHDGDLVTAPTREELVPGRKYMYCVEGNPCFPHAFRTEYFLPREPESWLVELSKTADPLLARSERELEEANRRRRLATSYRGFQTQRRCLWQLPKLMGSHFLGTWLICIPAQVSQAHLSYDQQSTYLLRALGALRLLRSKQRIVPDEAAYRALMVACGRAKSDRRVELVKLFGLLRSDGIFPSAVTLGQYTKALAEGYSKRSSGLDKDEDFGGVEVTESGSRVGRFSVVSHSPRGSTDHEATLNALDPCLSVLEDHGRRWRHRSQGRGYSVGDKTKRNSTRSWLPVQTSSSFVVNVSGRQDIDEEMRMLAIWSRTKTCDSCCYVPLEEEIQAGWDVVGGENEIPGSIACPRCGNLIVPMLGYRDLSLNEALRIDSTRTSVATDLADFGQLPPQIVPIVSSATGQEDTSSFVTYISPSTLRSTIESYVEEYGEGILEREKLKEIDREVWVNFWWYCARFSLPFPLPVTPQVDGKIQHYCAFAAWDRMVSERGCWSAAKVVSPLFVHANHDADSATVPSSDSTSAESLDEMHLLSRFNLQGFYSTVWDHSDISKILVTLVEACDKRDFKPVLEKVLEVNRRRREVFDSDLDNSAVGSDFNQGVEVNAAASDVGPITPSVELDVYRTLLYLAKYQCTTAFHSFFPATVKACKGYHYWCAIGTPLPMFDRLVRDAIHRVNNSKDNKTLVQLPTVSEVALGFRCVFGHLI